MSSRIDQSLSLMIPRVFPQWVDEQKMIDIFDQQHIGKVYKVSIIRMPDSKKRSYPIYQAFIYFSAWYDSEIAYNFQQRILGPRGQARVVYDDPWYWVVFENTKRRLSNADKRMIRLGQQAYVHEKYLLEQEERLRFVEDKIAHLISLRASLNESPPPREETVPTISFTQTLVNPHLSWNNLSEEFVMNTLGDDLALTETAMGVAESVLNDVGMDISDNVIPRSDYSGIEWFNSSWQSFQQRQLETSATQMLGEEMSLTETAINVAEAALQEDDDDQEVPDYYDDSSDYSYDKYADL
jgi:hypothetical protein